LETPFVIGYNLVPEPPASTIPFINHSFYVCGLTWLFFNLDLLVVDSIQLAGAFIIVENHKIQCKQITISSDRGGDV
jgi:hypothetical protein